MQFILFQPIRSKDMDSLGTARKMPDIQIIVPSIQKNFLAFDFYSIDSVGSHWIGSR